MNLFLFHLVYVEEIFCLLSDMIQNGKAVHFGYNQIENALNTEFCRYVSFYSISTSGEKDAKSIFPLPLLYLFSFWLKVSLKTFLLLTYSG